MTSVQINYDSVPRCPENAHDNIAYHLESLTIKEGETYPDTKRTVFGFYFDSNRNGIFGRQHSISEMTDNIYHLLENYFVIFILDIPINRESALPLLTNFKMGIVNWLPKLTTPLLRSLENSLNFIHNLYMLDPVYFSYEDVLTHRSPFLNIYGNYFLTNDEVNKAKENDIINRSIIYNNGTEYIPPVSSSRYTLARIFISRQDGGMHIRLRNYINEPFGNFNVDYSITKVYNVAIPILSNDIPLDAFGRLTEDLRNYFISTDSLNVFSIDSN